MNSAGVSNQQQFSQAPSANIQRSTFDRSSRCSTAFDAGLLIPFFWDEVIPGDTKKLTTGFLARLSTPIRPYMDNVYLDFHYFFVPNRLVHANWEKLCGAQTNPGDTTAYLAPQLSAATHAAGFAENSIFDYFGLPTKIAAIPQARMPNAFLLRAYNLCYNAWYRDENLQNSLTVDTSDGPDATVYTIRPRGRRKDYFTGALPFAQKGTAVSLPIGTSAPVVRTPNAPNPWLSYNISANTLRNVPAANYGTYAGGTAGELADSSVGARLTMDPNGGLYADLSAATASTINAFRQAIQLQGLFERDAKGGTRYVEILLAHYGVVSPDFRLQRPEYLGGGTAEFNVNPIAQTSPTAGTNPQGQLSAFVNTTGKVGFNHSFVEHGHIIGIVSVRAPVTYQQGLERMWSRQTRYDFYWPAFAHLGEQAILNKELMLQATAADELVYGYAERYSDLKYKNSVVTGVMRSNNTLTLDSWHLALNFLALPTLAQMVVEDPPIDRIIAQPTQPHVIFDSYTWLKDTRPMPTFATPGLLSRF